MTSTYKVGPGLLTLGTAPLDISAQMTACTVDPTEEVKTEEDIPVLSGDVVAGVDEVSQAYRLKGNLLQGLAVAGVVDFTWTNAGEVVPFTYVPNTAEGRSVTGQVRVVPLAIGGTVKERARSDFDWAIIGTPQLGTLEP